MVVSLYPQRRFTVRLSCQNGCDNFKSQFLRKPTLLVKHIPTGNVKAFCWDCISLTLTEKDIDPDSELNIDNATQHWVELKPDFENW